MFRPFSPLWENYRSACWGKGINNSSSYASLTRHWAQQRRTSTASFRVSPVPTWIHYRSRQISFLHAECLWSRKRSKWQNSDAQLMITISIQMFFSKVEFTLNMTRLSRWHYSYLIEPREREKVSHIVLLSQRLTPWKIRLNLLVLAPSVIRSCKVCRKARLVLIYLEIN